jgi:hypothetical protein
LKNVASGTYLSRCNNCWNNVIKDSWDDSAFVHVKNPSEGDWALWSPEKLDNNKWIIKGDNNEYLNVCNQCVVGGKWKDYAFVEVDNPKELDIAQWEITKV